MGEVELAQGSRDEADEVQRLTDQDGEHGGDAEDAEHPARRGATRGHEEIEPGDERGGTADHVEDERIREPQQCEAAASDQRDAAAQSAASGLDAEPSEGEDGKPELERTRVRAEEDELPRHRRPTRDEHQRDSDAPRQWSSQLAAAQEPGDERESGAQVQ
jgi:hypothetical protein